MHVLHRRTEAPFLNWLALNAALPRSCLQSLHSFMRLVIEVGTSSVEVPSVMSAEMRAAGRPSTFNWGVPDPPAGIVAGEGTVDDGRAADDAGGAPGAPAAPNRVIFCKIFRI